MNQILRLAGVLTMLLSFGCENADPRRLDLGVRD